MMRAARADVPARYLRRRRAAQRERAAVAASVDDAREVVGYGRGLRDRDAAAAEVQAAALQREEVRVPVGIEVAAVPDPDARRELVLQRRPARAGDRIHG